MPRAASAWLPDFQSPFFRRARLVAGSLASEVQRLKTRAQFQAVMAGNTVSRTAHFALHRSELPAATAAPAVSSSSEGPGSTRPQALFDVTGAWLGALVPKRWARRAVTRNTIKRQIYAVGDQFAQGLDGGAHVVRLRSGFDKKQFPSATSEPLKHAVRAELLQLFGQFTRRAAVSTERTAP